MEELTPQEFAGLHGVSRRTVERLIERGLPHRRVGRKILIRREENTAPYSGATGRPKAGAGQHQALPPGAVRIKAEWGDGTFAEGALFADGQGYFASSEARHGYSSRLRELCTELAGKGVEVEIKASFKIHRQAGCGEHRYVLCEGSGDLRTGVLSSRSLAKVQREAKKWAQPASVCILDSKTWLLCDEDWRP